MQQATFSTRKPCGSGQAISSWSLVGGWVLSVGIFLGLSGCWAPPSAKSGAAQVANPMTIDAREYDRIYRASELTLRDQGYTIDWQGYRFGRLTTLPRATPTLFEPWHQGNQSAYPTLSATLNQERHCITVLIDPSPAAGSQPATSPHRSDYLWRVEVMIERAEHPQRRLAGSADGDSIWSDLADTPSELKERGIQGAYWMALGRDMEMEKRLMAAILRRSVLLTDRDMSPGPSSDRTEVQGNESAEVSSSSENE